MDSYDTRNQIIEAIIDSLENGKLTAREMNGRIAAAMESELAKRESEINVPLVNASAKLWEALHAREAPQVLDNKKKALTRVRDYLERTARPRVSLVTRIMRLAAVAAVATVLIAAVDLASRRQWLDISHSDDEQQFIVKGQSSNPGFVSEGIANPSDELQIIETGNFDEIVSFLGFEPPVPSWLPKGWSASVFFAERYGDSIEFSAFFEHENEEKFLVYELRRSVTVDDIVTEFEQNSKGDYVLTDNGLSVYLSQNIDQLIAVWIDGFELNNLSGPCSKEDMMKTIDSIE